MRTIIEVSKVTDGSMAQSDPQVFENRRRFLAAHSIAPDNTILVRLVYEGDDYCRYSEVNASDGGDGITRSPSRVSDALFTRDLNVALLLPLADCVGVVLVDEKQQILGVSHMGRHNLEQFGARRSVEFMHDRFGSNPADITVYMSPAAGRENYPLFAFDHRSLHDVTCEQLLEAGIVPRHIRTAEEDTTKHPEYFSHSEYLKGQQLTDGRHAIIAQLTS